MAIIKYFTIVICSFFIYLKITNNKNMSWFKIIAFTIFAIGLSYLTVLAEKSIPNLRVLFLIIFSSIFMTIMTKCKFNFALTVMIISLGMSYALFIISILIAQIFTMFVLRLNSLSYTSLIIAFAIQAILSNILFMFKRLRNGFTFINNAKDSSIGIFLSSLIILFTVLVRRSDIEDYSTGMILIIGAIICTIGVISWWQNNITKSYKDRLRIRDIEETQKIIDEKDKIIEKLNESNSFLSELIHKDNKTIPAIETTVKNFIYNVIKEESNPNIQQNGLEIIEQLEQMIYERSNILAKNQRANKLLPTTKLPFIDGVFDYMLIKATSKDIDFDLTVTGSIKYMTENIISEDNLKTLIADQLENAIIAVSLNKNDYKKIFVTIGVTSDYYEFTVKDSGTPFEIDTLMSLGDHQVTTHADNGGSGIGFMSIFRILQESGASIIIEEYIPQMFSYSKKISIKFDGKNEYQLHSFRADELKSRCHRMDIMIFSY